MKKTQIGIHLPIELQEIMKEICCARGLNPARDLHRLYDEAALQFIAHIDRKTGWPRQPSSWMYNFPSVCETLGGCNQADDAELFRALDALPLMTWVGGQDGTIYVSPELTTCTGTDSAKFLGRGWMASLHRDDRDRVMKKAQEHFRTHQAFKVGYRLRCADGTYIGIVDHACPRFRADGRLAGFIGTMYATIPEAEDEDAGSFILATGSAKSDVLKHINFALKTAYPFRKRPRKLDLDLMVAPHHSSE